MGSRDPGPERLDRSAFALVFADDFTAARATLTAGSTTTSRTGPRPSAPRPATPWTATACGCASTPTSLPQDGEMRASNLQTGPYSGPLGSPLGQMRHRTGLRVRSPQPTRRLWTPSGGPGRGDGARQADPACMTAIWLVGFQETSPEESGEVGVAELFGAAIGAGRSQVRLGIKAHQDPRLLADVVDVVLAMDATEDHTYAAEWSATRTRFFVDDRLVRAVEQGLDYPLQLMVDLFEFPSGTGREPAGYPKWAQVRGVRATATAPARRLRDR